MRSTHLFVFCCHPNICLKSPFIVHPMKQSLLGPLRLLPIVVIAASCSKSNSHSDVAANGAIATNATFTTDVTKSPYYGDSILYVRGDEATAYQFKPTNNLGTGTYVAWPAGITIDSKTGIIDASKSEPGSRYNVGFVSASTGDTAYNQVIVDGVTYVDGIYALDSKTAFFLLIIMLPALRPGLPMAMQPLSWVARHMLRFSMHLWPV